MKTQIRSLLTLVCAAAASLLITGSPAQAGYIVTLKQVGSDVVATGSGAIDLTGLSFLTAATGPLAQMTPSFAQIITGPTSGSTDMYFGTIAGPTNFGSGGFIFASSGSGDVVGLNQGDPSAFLFLPQGYLSGNALSDSSTYNNATFASLGVTPGIYRWIWGDGADQNFTLIAVPDEGSSLTLMGIVLLCWLGFGVARGRVTEI